MDIEQYQKGLNFIIAGRVNKYNAYYRNGQQVMAFKDFKTKTYNMKTDAYWLNRPCFPQKENEARQIQSEYFSVRFAYKIKKQQGP